MILSDGVPPNTIRANGFAVATWLWLDGPAATVDDGGDEPDGRIRLEPPAGGCSVRIIRFPGAREGGGDWIRVEGDDPDEPGMHATDTLDFMVVVDGRIVLGLDDGEHELGAGDVVIQRGNRHRWRVVGDDPCTYVVCMLRPDPDMPAAAEPQQRIEHEQWRCPATRGGDRRARTLVRALRRHAALLDRRRRHGAGRALADGGALGARTRAATPRAAGSSSRAAGNLLPDRGAPTRVRPR